MLTQPTDTGALDPVAPVAIHEFGLVVGAIVLAYVLSALLTAGTVRLTARAVADLHGVLIAELRPAIFFGHIAVAAAMSMDHLYLTDRTEAVVLGLLGTAVALLAGRRLFRSAQHVIRALGRPEQRRFQIPRRLVPLAEYTAQIVIWLGMLYVVVIAWDLPATLLGSSAGMIGLAFGFAVGAPLRNLIAGVIIADHLCQPGDFLALPDGNCGHVSHIGLRSVRILTLDGVEINIPNALLCGSRVVDESAGSGTAIRLKSQFVLEFGRDVEYIQRLIGDMPSFPALVTDRRPELKVRALDERGMHLAVYFWIADPSCRAPAMDAVNTWLYKHLSAAGMSFALP